MKRVKRRGIGRLAKTSDIISIVAFNDPAIDEERSNLDAYRTSLKREHLVFHEGKLPKEYEIRPLSKREMREAQVYAASKATWADDEDSNGLFMSIAAYDILFGEDDAPPDVVLGVGFAIIAISVGLTVEAEEDVGK